MGTVADGVLHGDLVVAGSGDPSIDDWDGYASGLFDLWAAELRARGIGAVTGRVVGDDNRLPDVLLGPGWAWDDLDRSFATGAGALQFNQNTVRLRIAPGAAPGDPAAAALEPAGSGLTIFNRTRTTARRTPARLETRRGAGSPVLDVSGTVPQGGAILRNVSVVNPTLYFVTALRDRLIASGVEIRGDAVDVDDLPDPPAPPPGTAVVTHRSVPLSALAATTMKLSQNLFAETLFQAAGGPEGVRRLLSEWGIDEAAAVVADGSGLSRYNLATAEAIVAVLARVHRDDRLRAPFQASLAVAGRDGTLANRMAGTAAEANARAKTGALSNARGLSGFVHGAAGEPIAFSILANNFGTSADVVERAMDAIVVRLAEFSR